MNGYEIKQTLQAGGRVYGTAIEGYNQPRWPTFFASVGLDFVFLDNEHTPLNRETVAWATHAYSAIGIAPLLRIPEPSPTLAAMNLDAGAHGIIVPYVETADQVKALVGAVKYRPLKGEALQVAVEHDRFPNEETRSYLEDFNPNALLIIMIESRFGVDNLAQLLEVPGVDVVLIGPHDLSVSYGVPEQYDHEDFRAAVAEVVRVCQDHNVGVGMHITSGSTDQAIQWVSTGFNFVCVRSDTLYVARGIQSELAALRGSQADQPITTPDADKLGASGHG